MIKSFCTLLLATALCLACGHKKPSIALKAKATPDSVVISFPMAVPGNDPAVSYDVFRGTVSGGPYTQLNTSVVTASPYTDSTVAAGTTYYYTMKSVDASGNLSAGYSNEIRAIVPGATPPPPPPPPTTVPYVLQPSVTSLTFTGQSGAINPSSQPITIADSTPCPPPTGVPVCHWPVVITSSQPWLTATPASGTTSWSTSVSVNTSGLAVGSQQGALTLTVTPQGGLVLSNSPVTIPVTLNVTAPPPPPSLGMTCTGSASGATTETETCKFTGWPKGTSLTLTATPPTGKPVTITVSH